MMRMFFIITIVTFAFLGFCSYSLQAADDNAEESIPKIAAEIVQALTAAFKPIEGKVVLIKENKEVYINLGQEAGVKVGDEFEIVSRITEIRDPDTDELLAKEKEVVAEIKIVSVQAAKLSIGEITTQLEGKEIQPRLQVFKKRQGKLSVAILPFEDKAKSERVNPEALLDELYRQMEATEAFDMLEKEKSKTISAERSAKEIGETLNVVAIVKGELSKRGNVIRVEAQLIECASDRILAEAATELQVRGKGYIKPAGGPDKIVVVHVNGWLFTLDIDGSNKRMLARQLNANAKVPCERPAVSPDGRKIAFIQNKKVWVINSDGSQLSLLGYEGYGGWPPWTHQKDEIILSEGKSVSIVDVNGVKPPRRLEGGIGMVIPEPAGSAYLLLTDAMELYIADADLENRKLLVKKDVNVYHLGMYLSQTWSPYGTKISYWTWSGDAKSFWTKTFLIDRDGSNRKELVNKFASVIWSPGGNKMVFAFIDDNDMKVLNIADADGSNQKVLATYPLLDIESRDSFVFSTMFSFSPDGSRIAFWAPNRDKGPANLHSVNIEDSSDTILSRRWYEAGTLCWSSDGTKLIFTAKTTKDSNYNLYSVDADGSNEKQLMSHVLAENQIFTFQIFQYPFEESEP